MHWHKGWNDKTTYWKIQNGKYKHQKVININVMLNGLENFNYNNYNFLLIVLIIIIIENALFNYNIINLLVKYNKLQLYNIIIIKTYKY